MLWWSSFVVLPSTSHAQQADSDREPRSFEVKALGGFSTFIDDDFVEHVVLGASVRLDLEKPWNLEPQFLYMRGSRRDEEFYVLLNVVRNLETRGWITPYLVIGTGAYWHMSTFGRPPQSFFSEPRLHASGGAGARIRLAERWTLSSEARFGVGPFFQAYAGVGYAF